MLLATGSGVAATALAAGSSPEACCSGGGFGCDGGCCGDDGGGSGVSFDELLAEVLAAELGAAGPPPSRSCDSRRSGGGGSIGIGTVLLDGGAAIFCGVCVTLTGLKISGFTFAADAEFEGVAPATPASPADIHASIGSMLLLSLIHI